MKKIFTLITMLAAALPPRAQGFVFQYHGQGLADGETVVVVAEEDVFGELSCETNSTANPSDGLILKLLGSPTANASATLQISHNSLDAGMLQWCMGDECTPLGSQTSLTKRFSVTGTAGVQLDAYDIRSEGFLEATVKASVGLESHEVRILFVNGDVDGIGSAPSEGRRETVGYDLSGRQVRSRTLPGLYVVTDGTRSRKVAVK